MPGPDPLGVFGAMALGAVGAVIGYAVALQFGLGAAEGQYPVCSLGVAIVSCFGASSIGLMPCARQTDATTHKGARGEIRSPSPAETQSRGGNYPWQSQRLRNNAWF